MSLASSLPLFPTENICGLVQGDGDSGCLSVDHSGGLHRIHKANPALSAFRGREEHLGPEGLQ